MELHIAKCHWWLFIVTHYKNENTSPFCQNILKKFLQFKYDLSIYINNFQYPIYRRGRNVKYKIPESRVAIGVSLAQRQSIEPNFV